MGGEWRDKPRSPMDTGGSGKGSKKMTMFAIAFVAGGAAFVLGPLAYVLAVRFAA